MRIRVLGLGMGPQHVTEEVGAALRSVAYVVAAEKSSDDPVLAVRQAVCEEYGVELIAVPDPARDRDDPADYPRAVRDWHGRRLAAYERAMRHRSGDAAFLVWGDPALYDSTIRIVEQLAPRLDADWDVLPGISAPQLLAARHRLVLNPIGGQVHVTTARRLREAVDSGEDNLVVFLGGELELTGLEDWSIWWGANLGTTTESLVSGRVGQVLPALKEARAAAKAAAGWVMDLYLLRRPT